MNEAEYKPNIGNYEQRDNQQFTPYEAFARYLTRNYDPQRASEILEEFEARQKLIQAKQKLQAQLR